MEMLVYGVPSLVIALALFGMAKVINKARRTYESWHGLTAEAHCLRTYATISGGGDTSLTTTRHHVFEFTTHKGRTVRFAEEDAPLTILEGEIATVYYAPRRPEDATAKPPAVGKLAQRTGFALLALSPFVIGCIVIMVQLGPRVGD
ncbi:hypothetical protein ACWFRM_25880 [Streptomyces sp. NPDC055144]